MKGRWAYGLCLVVCALMHLSFLRAQEPILLEPSVVSASRPLVKAVGDTLVFNPDALPLEDDASLEDLLKMIPGLAVEGGEVTLYGRRIEKMLVGGKLYFGGDVAAGLRNLRAEEIESVASYQRPSDFARISGIDDGEEEPVLDVKIKKQFLNALKGRARAGGGYPAHFLASVNGGVTTDTSRVSFVLGANNTLGAPDILSQNTSRIGTGSAGYPLSRDAGLDFNLKRGSLDMTAHVRYDGNDHDRYRENWTRNVYSGGKEQYTTARYEEQTRSDKVTANFEAEWRPRKDLYFFFKPEFVFNGTLTSSDPASASYRRDPLTDEDPALINRVLRRQTSLRNRTEGRMTFQVTKRFAKKGRSFSFRTFDYFSGGEALNFNDYLALTATSLVRKQYVTAPWLRNDFNVQFSWNEPLGKHWYLQALLAAKLSVYGLDRSFYSLDRLPGTEDWTVPMNLSRAQWMASLPADYKSSLDETFTSSGTYLGILTTGTLSLRYVRKRFNTTFGVSVRPTWGLVRFHTQEQPSGSKPSFVCYAAPHFTLRYNKSRQEFVSLIYKSSVGTPSTANLLPVRSGTNPLYVSEGNPSLKPSFTHRLTLKYNYSHPKGGRSVSLEASGRVVQNGFATDTEFIPETGGRISRSVNVDGNWSAAADVVYNQSVKGTPLTVSNHLNASVGDDVVLLYDSSLKASERSVLRRIAVRDRLDLTARWKSVMLTGRVMGEWLYERSLQRPEFSQMPWMVGGALLFRWNLPRRWTISTDFNPVLSRGNGYPGLDGMYYYWNASVSKGFFDGKMLLRLTGNNLLGEERNSVRRFAASSRSVYRYLSPGRCVLLQLSVKF